MLAVAAHVDSTLALPPDDVSHAVLDQSNERFPAVELSRFFQNEEIAQFLGPWQATRVVVNILSVLSCMSVLPALSALARCLSLDEGARIRLMGCVTPDVPSICD